jgi:hypothetical protein
MLRYSEVGCIDLSQVHAVPGLDYGIEQFENVIAVFRRQETFDILKDESGRSESRDGLGKPTNERVPVIPLGPHSRRREPLARRPSDDDARVRKIGECGHVNALDSAFKIQSVRLDRGRVVVHCKGAREPGLGEALREPTCPAEEIEKIQFRHPVRASVRFFGFYGKVEAKARSASEPVREVIHKRKAAMISCGIERAC